MLHTEYGNREDEEDVDEEILPSVSRERFLKGAVHVPENHLNLMLRRRGN